MKVILKHKYVINVTCTAQIPHLILLFFLDAASLLIPLNLTAQISYSIPELHYMT